MPSRPTTWCASETSRPRPDELPATSSESATRACRGRCSAADDASAASLRSVLGPPACRGENNSAVVICFFSSLLEDEAKIQNDQKPLQAQIDVNQTRLTAIGAEILSLEQTLGDLKRQRDTTHASIDAVKAEMAKSGAAPPTCSQSRLTSRIQALCQQYNTLVAAHNALVDQHNGAVSRRNSLADEHNRVIAVTNGLIEALNWTR